MSRLRLTGDGPVLVDGPVEIVLPDGRSVRADRPVTALCTCRMEPSLPLLRHKPPQPRGEPPGRGR